MHISVRGLAKASILAGTALAGAAQAQVASPDPYSVTRVPDASVDANTQARKQDPSSRSLEPAGLHAGSLTIYPRLETALTYDSNIYALERETDDFIARLSPSVTVAGDFGILASTIQATLDSYRYFDNTRENRTDASIGGNHQLELAPETFINASGAYSRNHEDRGNPNTLTTNRSPTRYTLSEASLGATRDLAQLRAGISAGIRRFNYRDAQRLGGGFNDYDFRDRNEIKLDGRLGYQFSPGYVLFGRVEYDKADYDNLVDNGGFQRDSEGIRVTGGVQFELTRLLTGDIRAGYFKRSYEDPRFDNVTSPVVAAALTWTPTPITTVRLNADRTVQETVFTGFRGFLHTGGGLSIEHELRRQITLTGGVSYYRDNYKRGNVAGLLPRTDNNYGANAGLRYILNRNIYTGVNYEFIGRGSSAVIPGSDYKRHKVLALVGVQL